MKTIMWPGYYRLLPGAEFIVWNGVAVDIAAVTGERIGSNFAPASDSCRYPIRVRVATAQEQKAMLPVLAPLTVSANDAFTDWK